MKIIIIPNHTSQCTHCLSLLTQDVGRLRFHEKAFPIEDRREVKDEENALSEEMKNLSLLIFPLGPSYGFDDDITD